MKNDNGLLTEDYLATKPSLYSWGATILALLFVVLTFASIGAVRDTHAVDKTIVATVVMQGGKCVDSVTCSTAANLYSDGTFDGRTYKVSEVQMKTLASVLEDSDLNSLTEDTEPDCQSFVDGQDAMYVFPEAYGSAFFTPCRIEDADNVELFQFLDQIITTNPVDDAGGLQ